MARRDTRLKRAAVEGFDQGNRLWTLLEPAWSGDEGTRGQRAFARVIYFARDTGNGGLEQSLWNRSTREVEDVIASFDLIGLGELARMLERAERTYYPDSRGPESLDDRRDWIKRRNGDSRVRAELEQLWGPLYDEVAMFPAMERYVAAHPDEFFVD